MNAQVSQAHVLRQATAAVARCEHQQPEEAKRSFAESFVRVVQVRNWLIGQASEQEVAAAVRPLQDANSLLSLMASIEFPVGGFHNERFASTVLQLQRLAEQLDQQPWERSSR